MFYELRLQQKFFFGAGPHLPTQGYIEYPPPPARGGQLDDFDA